MMETVFSVPHKHVIVQRACNVGAARVACFAIGAIFAWFWRHAPDLSQSCRTSRRGPLADDRRAHSVGRRLSGNAAAGGAVARTGWRFAHVAGRDRRSAHLARLYRVPLRIETAG